MFCIHCGHESDSNNVCHNNLCPSKTNNNLPNQNYNNSNINQNFSSNIGFNYYNTHNYNPDFVDKNGINLSDMTEFIGSKNTYFYIEKWTANQDYPNFISWNWPAFFSPWIWLFYRKLNLFGSIYLAIYLLSLIFLPMSVFSVILFASNISCALLGNQIYIKHCIKKITLLKASSMNMDIDTYYRRLRNSGGTSVAALIIGIIIGVITTIFIGVNYISDNYIYEDPYKSNPYSSPFDNYDGPDSNDSFDNYDTPDSDDSFDNYDDPNSNDPFDNYGGPDSNMPFYNNPDSNSPKLDDSTPPSVSM